METNMKLNGEAPPVKRKCLPLRKRTRLERYLIAICVVMFIAFVTMVAIVLYLDHIYTKPKVPICKTAVCTRKAGRMMSLMDFEVDPCEDFYNFSCGSFKKVMPAPSNMVRYGSFAMAETSMSRITEELLAAEEEDEPEFVKKVRRYYKGCLNLDTETSVLIEQFLNNSGLYRWPILEHDDYEDEDQLVERALALVEINNGYGSLLNLFREQNYTAPQIGVYAGRPFGKEEIFLNDTDASCIRKKEKYRALLTYSFFKAGTQLEAIESEVDELIQFETLFANISADVDRIENSTGTTLKEFTEECQELRLTDIVRYIYEYFGHSEEFTDTIPLEIGSKPFFDDLCKLLGGVSRRLIYNYVVWRYLAQELRKYDHYYERTHNDVRDEEKLPQSKPRMCLERLKDSEFIHGLNYMVIKHLDPEKTLEEVTEYSNQIKEAMDQMFAEESWLDDDSKKLARERLANVTAIIGYCEETTDVGFLENFYSHVNVSENLIENHFIEGRREARTNWFNDTFTADYNIKIRHPLSAGAFFMGDRYVLQLGIMQPPFFEYGAPKYVNFAVIGFIIAHELSHGYDSLDRESKHNRTGNTDNWPDEIVEAFKERKECYVNQYSQYPIDDNGTMVDGNDTVADNIADNSGIVQAFKAYEKYYLSKPHEPRLPGLDYTIEQLFFISFAQSWCETVRDPIKVFQFDMHSPGRYRVIGPLQNFPRFSEVFKCPVGSPMNPKEKCRMWG